ncbi:MAG: transposase [Coriobacteriales bacterium]|nr:transposase [Coriobacteriales bacterium]
MTRSARQISETGVYHVVFRGVNHCHLFEQDSDHIRFLEIVKSAKEKQAFDIYAYCLMSNHVHLLLREDNPYDLPQIMRRILAPYAGWFNRAYKRSGALISNRYTSEPVTTDSHLLTVLRYIHQNPASAGMVKAPGDYRWSSYSDYLGVKGSITATGMVLGMFSDNEQRAVEGFKEFHEKSVTQSPSIPEGKKLSKDEVLVGIRAALGGIEPLSLPAIDSRDERDRLLLMLRSKGYSIRQIERATGVSRGIVTRCGRLLRDSVEQ